MEHRDEILKEIVGSCWSQSAIHIAVNKKLIADISNQTKISHAIVLADTSNCFDCVAYLILALTCKYFKLADSYIQTFFDTIQNMKMYLMIAHSLSNIFYTGS